MSDKMREEFEAWARDSGEWDGEDDPFDWICYVTPDGTYYADSLELAWVAWQAARSIEVELPKVTEFANVDLPGYVLDRCRGMLSYQGVKVKP